MKANCGPGSYSQVQHFFQSERETVCWFIFCSSAVASGDIPVRFHFRSFDCLNGQLMSNCCPTVVKLLWCSRRQYNVRLVWRTSLPSRFAQTFTLFTCALRWCRRLIFRACVYWFVRTYVCGRWLYFVILIFFARQDCVIVKVPSNSVRVSV